MPIVLSSLLATSVGAGVVYLTSPTLAYALSGIVPLSLLTYHSLAIDALFAILIGFLILCYVETRWIAINQSFPYTFHIKRNLGHYAFDFQLVVFELWHTNKLNRYVHMICLFCEEFFWLYIAKATFGLYGLMLLNLLSITQAWSFGDWTLTATVALINGAYSLVGLWAFDRLAPILAVDICKVALFWVVVLRTAVHAAEPLPPTFDSNTNTFGDGWGAAGYELIPREPVRALWLFILGIVSELASGIPGRLFGTAVFKVIYRLGYRSGHLKGVDEAREEAMHTLLNGWGSNAMLAPFFEMNNAAPVSEKSLLTAAEEVHGEKSRV